MQTENFEAYDRPDERARVVAIDRLVPWPGNPRRTFGDIEGLAEAIANEGVLQSLLVRPSAPGKLEIICGERRWRAAREAGLAVIPIVLREDLVGDDGAALMANVSENLQRADVHPLEEADGIMALRERRSVEDIASRLGRHTSYVYRRLALCGLSEKARELFLDARLTEGAAELIARLADHAAQDKIVASLLLSHGDGSAITREEAKWSAKNAMLKLASAPWDLADAKLVPAAGACSTCPKRTAAQALLFDEPADDDQCVDAACFASKKEAHAKRRIADAKQAGAKILTADEAKKLYATSFTSQYEVERAGYYDVDRAPQGAKKKWREILGDREVERVVAKDPHSGEVHELVRVSAVKKVLAKDPRKGDPKPEGSASKSKSKSSKAGAKGTRSKEDLILDAKDEAVGAILDELAARIGAELTLHDGLRFLAESMLSFGLGDDVRMARRVGVTGIKGYDPTLDKKIINAIAKASPEQLLAMCFEATLCEDFPHDTSGRKSGRSVAQRAIEHAGVDWLGIEKRAIEDATATPGTCRVCGCTEGTGVTGWVDESKSRPTAPAKTLCGGCEGGAKPAAKKGGKSAEHPRDQALAKRAAAKSKGAKKTGAR